MISDPAILQALAAAEAALAEVRRLVGERAPETAVVDGVERLRRACAERGITPVDDAIGEADAAAMIGRSASTLRRWRDEGTGPPWRRYLGRIQYPLADLAAFIAQRTEESSE